MILCEHDMRVHLALERHNLYAKLRHHSNRRVAKAIALTPRENFIDPMQRFIAYDNQVIPVEDDSYATSVSQPTVVADMVQLLDPQPDDFVIEYGAGSGFQAAVLGSLVKHVLAIEIGEGLARKASQRTRRLSNQ